MATMESVENSTTESVKKIAIHLVNQVSEGPNHAEVWQTIASLTSPQQQDLLKNLTLYFSQLASIPQSEEALRCITALEAMCVAYSGNEDEAVRKLNHLMEKYPDSLIFNSALMHLKQKNTPPATNPASLLSNNSTFLKAFSEFITAQNAISTALIKKLDSMEQTMQINAWNLQQQMHQIQQSVHLSTRQTARSKNRRIRCVFLISFLQSWNTLASVYYAMKASDDFDPIVISTARKRAKDTHVIFGEEQTHQFLESENIPHIRLNTGLPDNNCLDILKALEPDLIFRQSAYHDLPPIFNAADINFARLCYIPYSFTAVKRISHSEPIDATSSANHTDLYYHRLCWRIFCETEMHKSMYVDTSVRSGENVVVTGYPKFDHLVSAKERPAFWPIASDQRRLRIIWAPHHSVTPEIMGFGTFIETHKDILEWAKQYTDSYEFVMKPHPALVSEVVHEVKAFSQEYMDAFFAEWKSLPNTAIFEGGDYGPLFMGSDVMLTDGVGFLSEYQLFEKPLIFLDSGHHFGFNAAGNVMMRSANKFRTVAEVKHFCENLRQGGSDPMRESQQQVLSQIMPYPGQSAQKILQAIREGLIAEGVIV